MPFSRRVSAAALAMGLAAALSAPVGHAQSADPAPAQQTQSDPAPAPAPANRTYLTAEEFRQVMEGRTVVLALNGAYFAAEQYLGGDRAIWRPRGGACQPGVWIYAEPTFCFYYGYGRIEDNCWFVYEQDGVYFAESSSGQVLEIVSITDEPLDCQPNLSS